MKRSDINRLERIHDVLAAVPTPAVGTQSQTAAGLAGYCGDMVAVVPWVRRALRGVALRDDKRAAAGQDYDDPDLILEALGYWVRARRKADWQPPTPDVDEFYPRVEGQVAEVVRLKGRTGGAPASSTDGGTS